MNNDKILAYTVLKLVSFI